MTLKSALIVQVISSVQNNQDASSEVTADLLFRNKNIVFDVFAVTDKLK